MTSVTSEKHPPGAETGQLQQQPQANPRGIPLAPFIENIEDYITSLSDVDPTLKKFQEMVAKYQFMESNTQRRAVGLRDKIPDIEKTLETVRFLTSVKDSSKSVQTTFELNDTLYATASIPPVEDVYLWLGANVMLSYTIDEAERLLVTKLSAAKESLLNCEEDVDYLRHQITTLEVNISRIYNFSVTEKRKRGSGTDAVDVKGGAEQY